MKTKMTIRESIAYFENILPTTHPNDTRLAIETALRVLRLKCKKPVLRYKPCVCGAKYGIYGYGYDDSMVRKCKKCGKKAEGINEAQLRINWNKMIDSIK